MTAGSVPGPLPRPGVVPPPGCPAHGGAGGLAQSLYGSEFAADPGAVYARLRRHGPAAPVELAPGVRATLVTGYEAALTVLRSPETFSKDARRWRDLAEGVVAPDSPVVPMMTYRPSCLWTDGDEHRRLRAAVSDSLARVDPNALRGYVEHSADTLIDRFAPDGEADLLEQYARDFPLLVFEQLFGCPAHLGSRLIISMASLFDGVDVERSAEVLTDTLGELVALKRERPGDDLPSWMMRHPSALTDEEMLHQLVAVMGVGSEPQKNLIGNGLRLLLADDRFGGDLASGSLPVEAALDEVLWTDPPLANYAIHYPVRDTELGGVPLREGEPVVVSLAAANSDPALGFAAAAPDGGGPGRRSGNRAHLAWSAGPHTCPAKDAGRMIAAVAIEKLLDRLPDVELAVPPEQLQWRTGPFNRALVSLPVRFPPLTAAYRIDRNALVTGRWPGRATASPPPPVPSAVLIPVPRLRPDSRPGRVRRWWDALARWWRGQ